MENPGSENMWHQLFNENLADIVSHLSLFLRGEYSIKIDHLCNLIQIMQDLTWIPQGSNLQRYS